MKKIGSKRHRGNAALLEKGRLYAFDDALALLKKFAAVKFDQTVEIAVRLGIDAKKTEQGVRGSVALPKGIGKTRKVIVFADGEEAEQAEKMGADVVGGADLVKKVEGGWTDFDIAIAHPRMMKLVGKLGKLLGPQGKMPTPKSGTVTEDISTAVKEFKAGKVEFKSDKTGIIHAPMGKMSFKNEDLKENIAAFLDHVIHHKPAAAKGKYVVSAVVSSTMGPGIPLVVAEQ